MLIVHNVIGTQSEARLNLLERNNQPVVNLCSYSHVTIPNSSKKIRRKENIFDDCALIDRFKSISIKE